MLKQLLGFVFILFLFFSLIAMFLQMKRIPDGKSPRFPKKPTIRQDGDILMMECVLEAHPIPDITWFQGEKSVIGSERIKMSRKAIAKDTYVLTLEISNPTRDDGGNYRCNAFNMYGESNANIALNFQGILPRICLHNICSIWLNPLPFMLTFEIDKIDRFDDIQSMEYGVSIHKKCSHIAFCFQQFYGFLFFIDPILYFCFFFIAH